MSGTHETWELLIGQYRDGELGEIEQRSVKGHLAECEPCRVELEQYEKLARLVVLPGQQALARLQQPKLDALWAGIAAQIEKQPRPGVFARFTSRFAELWQVNWRMAAAAGVAACLTLVVAVPLLRSTSGGAGPATSSVAPVVAGNEVIVDSLQSGQHDMVLVNVHPEDMTTVIWLLEDGEPAVPAVAAPGSAAPDAGVLPAVPAAPSAGAPPVANDPHAGPAPVGPETDGK